jgi:hypothetical protein
LPFAAAAVDFNFGDVDVNLKSRYAAGVAMRMEKPADDLLGKLNVPGQQSLCVADDCQSFSGNPEPNQRLVNARGSFTGSNFDNGDLNYRQYGVVAATNQLRSDLTVNWRSFTAHVSGIGFFDPANIDFDETHTDTRFQPAKTARPSNITRQYARGGQLLDGYVQYGFKLGEHSVTTSVGYQNLRWGESNYNYFNSLNEINPPSAVLKRMPGSDISSVFRSEPLALVSVDIVDHVSLDAIYQFGWRPVQADPSGSFYSDEDLVGGGRYLNVGLGTYSEDPNRLYKPPAPNSLISSSTRTAYPLADNYGYPHNEADQYGARLNYFAEWLNGGTQLALHFLNYHSRFPYLSVLAADESCTRNGNPNIISAFIACKGFNGRLNPSGNGLEPLPVDTLKPFLDYPENIQMYGASFNTSIGSWSLSAEYSYRPNLPAQVQLTDVLFTGLQPAFPLQDIPTFINGNIIPGVDHGAPSFLAAYRHYGTVRAGQYIPGYERLRVGEMDFTALKAISNTLGANQIIFGLEGGMTNVFNLPSTSELQFDGGTLNRTHFSPGADGTGSGGVPDTLRVNPTQQHGGIVTDLSYGVRVRTSFEYDDVIWGLNFKPILFYSRDIHGIAPFPVQNFVQNRTEFDVGTDIEFTQSLAANINYEGFLGGGQYNTRRDRDNLSLSVSYNF